MARRVYSRDSGSTRGGASQGCRCRSRGCYLSGCLTAPVARRSVRGQHRKAMSRTMEPPDARLARLADLLREKNAIDREIAAVLGRPALQGHAGEYIAAAVFDIELHP